MLYKKKLTAVTLATALATLPIVGFAAGFQISENSPRLQGQALAGNGSTAGDVTAIFNNPAVLATIKKQQVYVGASYIDPRISMKNASAQHAVIEPGIFPPPAPLLIPVEGDSSQASIAKSALVPSMYYVLPLKSKWSIGMALTAPWGLTTQYDSDSVVRFMAQQTSLTTVNLNPQVAYNLNQHWKFGLGLQVQYADAIFSNFNGNAIPIFGMNPSTNPTTLNGNGWGVGYNAGILFSPNKDTNIGVSYRSQIDYNIHGNVKQYVMAGPIQPPVIPGYPFNSEGAASATLNTPAVVNLSVTQKLNKQWEVASTVEMTMWSSLKTLKISMPDGYAKSADVVLNWRNSLLYSLGTQYTLNKHWQFRAGAAYDQTPTTDQYRDARIPDTTRYWLTTGLSYAINQHFRIDAAMEHIFMTPSKIDITQHVGTPSATQPGEVNTVKADYTGYANIVSLGMKWEF